MRGGWDSVVSSRFSVVGRWLSAPHSLFANRYSPHSSLLTHPFPCHAGLDTTSSHCPSCAQVSGAEGMATETR